MDSLSGNILNAIKPHFEPDSNRDETPAISSIIKSLSLEPHVEGGYFAVTDVSKTKIPSPYPREPLSQRTIDLVGALPPDFDYDQRLLSTTIYYYLTPQRSTGSFHRNRSRIIHSLHCGRGRYVLIHPSGQIESFIVGKDLKRGEKLSWVVEGDVWKASFLLPVRDAEDSPGEGEELRQGEENTGLLITETVVPGFEYADHEFLSMERLKEIVPSEAVESLKWLVKH